MINALSIDVEDYHNIVARDWIGREGPPTRAVVENTARLLELLGRFNVRGTFFILGEVAEAFPQLVRDIASAGHEVGVHGFYHHQVFKLTPAEFRDEVTRAKAVLEAITGAPVEGHRAPAFSIRPETRWALDVLAETGFRYDSSIYPIRGRRYGWPGFPLHIHTVELKDGRRIVEAPLSTVSILGKRLPACGGGYLRHFPTFVTVWAFRRIRRCRPVILYLHPYEIELDAPWPDMTGLDEPAVRRLQRFHKLQLRNRATVEGKIVRLLTLFPFAPLRDVIGDVLGEPGPSAQPPSAGR